ncbi:hypothetical protein [Deinococcus sp. Leaf326]|uniref:hypothetical protein n=1 Tax=Deinococcus sp. Leaf326 TaxID=1736338 RepID=UPI0006FA4665|nr:hypothetical protein [Deinococcus sp. Leaf326]KQR15728.1 hypothetical protein ASF71_08920 [Deinococcus sp. Leaf326]
MRTMTFTLALLFASPVALATAPTPGYVQVQTSTDDTTTPADTTAPDTTDTTTPADTTSTDTTDTAVPGTTSDTSTSSSVTEAPRGNDFPWGLLGLLGLFGLMGRNRPAPAPVPTTQRTVTGTDRH